MLHERVMIRLHVKPVKKQRQRGFPTALVRDRSRNPCRISLTLPIMVGQWHFDEDFIWRSGTCPREMMPSSGVL